MKQSEREKSQLAKLRRNIKLILKGSKHETPATKRHKAGKVGSERVRKQVAKEAAIKAAGAAQFDREMKKALKKPKKKIKPIKIKPKKKKELKRLAPLKSALTDEEIRNLQRKRQR